MYKNQIYARCLKIQVFSSICNLKDNNFVLDESTPDEPI